MQVVSWCAYVKWGESSAVLIEGLVVVLDELLCDADQPRFKIGRTIGRDSWRSGLVVYILPTSSKACRSQSYGILIVG